MSKLTSVAALLVVMASAGAAFPVTLSLENSVWRSLVEPESGKEVPGCADGVPGSVSFELRSEDQFVRILSNVEQINLINGFVEGEGLSIVFPGVAQAPVDGGAAGIDGTGGLPTSGVGEGPSGQASSGDGAAATATNPAPAPADAPAPATTETPPPAPAVPDAPPTAPAPAAPAAGNKQSRGNGR